MVEKRKKEKKKMGRPTINPRPNRLSVRLSDADLKKLEKYCNENSTTKTEAISIGINKLNI